MGWNFLGLHELDLMTSNAWEFPFLVLPLSPLDHFALKVTYTDGVVMVAGKQRYPTITGLLGQFLQDPGPGEAYQVATHRLSYSQNESVVFNFGPQGNTYDNTTGQTVEGSTIWQRDAAGNLELRTAVETWIGVKAVPKKRGVKPVTIMTATGEQVTRYPWWYDTERSKFTIQVEVYSE